MRDSEFKREDKIPMTKEEIRYISLGYLEINNAKKMLDIGAGTGSVSFEALFSNKHLLLTAIEQNKAAYDLFLANMELFNEQEKNISNRIRLINDKAPTSEIEEKFDRIFIGGTGSNVKEIINWSYDLLEENGILVMNFITIENFYESLSYINEHRGFAKAEGGLVSINKFADIGPYQYMKPNNPTFILKTIKL